MNIVLVNPPRDNLVRLDLETFVDLGDISSFPPIGLMYLAQGLRNHIPDVNVSIIDAVVENLNYQQIAAKIVSLAPVAVGITLTTYTFFDAIQTGWAIKNVKPDVPVVVGGPHMYIFPEETMTHTCFDYGVVGDGENVFSSLCLMISGEKKINHYLVCFTGKTDQLKAEELLSLGILTPLRFLLSILLIRQSITVLSVKKTLWVPFARHEDVRSNVHSVRCPEPNIEVAQSIISLKKSSFTKLKESPIFSFLTICSIFPNNASKNFRNKFLIEN